MSKTQALIKKVSASKTPNKNIFGVLIGSVLAASAFPAVLLSTGDSNFPIVVWMLSAVLLASVQMFRAGSFFWQILARGVWFQSLVFGIVLLLAMIPGVVKSTLFSVGVLLILGGGIALASAGRHGFEQLSEQFVPVAFRRSLMISLVMAMADTQALLFYGGVNIEERYNGLEDSLPFFACAAVMLVAIFGLYRLKLWGLGLTIIANIAIATLAIGGVLEVPEVLAYGLAATAIIQLLIPMPLMREMLAPKKV